MGVPVRISRRTGSSAMRRKNAPRCEFQPAFMRWASSKTKCVSVVAKCVLNRPCCRIAISYEMTNRVAPERRAFRVCSSVPFKRVKGSAASSGAASSMHSPTISCHAWKAALGATTMKCWPDFLVSKCKANVTVVFPRRAPKNLPRCSKKAGATNHEPETASTLA